MSAIEAWVRTPAAQALGWALAHSIWQGALAALAVAASLWATRSAKVRYATACLALALLTGAFGWTWWRSIAPEAAPRAVTTFRAIRTAEPGAGVPRGIADGSLSTLLPWLAPVWAAGVLAFHLRALAGWSATRRLRRKAVCAPPAQWTERAGVLAGRLRVSRPVALLESGLAKAPVVAGYLRPVILMPAGLLAGLPAVQVEAILLHELAHIRRHDYLANVLQTWVESIFFYHPAVWWISGVIRAEREHCCDDVVVETQGDAHGYATALAALAKARWSAEPAVAATGGNLVKRVRRLLQYPEGPRAAFAPALSATVLAVAAAAGLMAWQSAPGQVRRQALRAALNAPYEKWVKEDVAYIIDDRERATFLELTSDAEREKFIEQFWTRRDPTPGTIENEFKQEHYRRIAYANERFAAGIPGWKTDRGRLYIVFGPPDEIESHPSGNPATGIAYPYEEWLYRTVRGIGDNVIVRFEDPAKSGEYRQTADPRVLRK